MSGLDLVTSPVRPAQRVCTDCKHLAVTQAMTGLFCMLFNEPLMDERTAQTCLGYERIDT